MDPLLQYECRRRLTEIIRACASWLVTGVVKMDGYCSEVLLRAG